MIIRGGRDGQTCLLKGSHMRWRDLSRLAVSRLGVSLLGRKSRTYTYSVMMTHVRLIQSVLYWYCKAYSMLYTLNIEDYVV